MFTGLIEGLGTVLAMERREAGWHLDLDAGAVAGDVGEGDSVAVDGVCLTVTHRDGQRLAFGLAPETMQRSSLGDRRAGDRVNLERSLPADGRVGGHFVQGHVEGTGRIEAAEPEGDSLRLTVSLPRELARYVVPKGFIAVDGVSLTVIEAGADRFSFMLVAYTQQHIALPQRPVGSRVNLETDVLARYVERLLQMAPGGPGG